MSFLRPFAGYLADEMAGLGFTDHGYDPEELGGYDAILTRVYRRDGVAVEVREDTGDVTVRLFGWGPVYGGDDTYRHGHLSQVTFSDTWPVASLLATVSALVAANVENAAPAAA
ncbi:hypothetical protein [Streptosporangium sandarakinum]|nr:hypothetical protein [Streptosporangium sandarakinum]